MQIIGIKICHKVSFITHETLHFYISVLDIKIQRLSAFHECDNLLPSMSARWKDPGLIFLVIK
jgi:hypothetical protein